MDGALRDKLRQSFMHLNEAWRFRLDPMDDGVAAGYFDPAFDRSAWAVCKTGETLDRLGLEAYRGVVWFVREVEVPAAWSGADVSFVSNGVRQSYRLFVNGRPAGGRGTRPDAPVSEILTRLPVGPLLRPGSRNTVALRVEAWSEPAGLWGNIFLKRHLPLNRELLPEPVGLPPAVVDLYWKAWDLAWDRVAAGSPQNGFSDLYVDEAFNEHVYQWDSCFMGLFLKYGAAVFPALEALDNFYGKQRADGYIQRIYKETDGHIVYPESPLDPNINPPLFAWVEWDYAEATGDDSRLRRVYPHLEGYFGWIDRHVRHPAAELYWQTEWGSGQDNTPRPPAPGGWIDMSAQMALFAGAMARICRHLGQESRAAAWEERKAAIAAAVNAHLWSDDLGFYVDVDREFRSAGVLHIGAFWTLIAGIAPNARAALLCQALVDPARFGRSHPFPSLAASDARYDPRGCYWQGGVWAPATYMVVKGLERLGRYDLADDAARRHIEMMSAVFRRSWPEALIHPQLRDGGDYRSIWECYAPDQPAPGTDAGGVWLGRHDFVGWSGLGPIALGMENLLGLRPQGLAGRLEWRLPDAVEGPLGIRRLRLRPDTTVSLRVTRQDHDHLRLDTLTDRAFELRLAWRGRSWAVPVPVGSAARDLDPTGPAGGGEGVPLS